MALQRGLGGLPKENLDPGDCNMRVKNHVLLLTIGCHSGCMLASFPGLPYSFCCSVCVDNSTRMRKSGEVRRSSASINANRTTEKNGVGLGMRLGACSGCGNLGSVCQHVGFLGQLYTPAAQEVVGGAY